MKNWPRWRELSRWRELPRWLKRGIVGLAGLLVFIPIVTNAILWLHVVPRLMNADSAAFEYRFAWAPWPTRIKVYDFVATGEDPNVQFAVALEEAWLTLDLWAAVSERTIRIDRVRGSGVSVRALQRLQPWALKDAKVNALPPIPGRTKPPITFAYVPTPRATRENYDLVSIDVRDIDATAKEIWIDEVRHRGNLHVTGAFLLRPGLELHIGPNAAVDIRNGEVAIAGIPVLAKLEGRATCETPYFNPVEPEGVAILRFFSGSITFSADLVHAEAANYLAPAGVEVRGGAGRVALRFAFDRGVVRPGSALDIESRDLQVTAAKTRLDTSLSINGAVDASGRGTLRAATEHLSLGRQGQRARFSGGELRAEVATKDRVDLAEPKPTLSYSMKLEPLAGDAAALAAYLPESAPITLDSGRLKIGGQVAGTVGKPDLRATAGLDGELAAHTDGRRFAGKLDVRGHLAEGPERMDLTGSKVAVSDLMVAQGEDVTYGWWTHAEVTNGGLVTGGSPRLEVALAGGLRNIEPLFVAYGKEIGVPKWVQGLLPLPNTSWRGHLAAEAAAVRISDFRATSGAVVVLLKLKKPPGAAPIGAVKLAAGPLSFGVAFAANQTESQLLATDAWFEKQR